jgi:hypothetical protein
MPQASETTKTFTCPRQTAKSWAIRYCALSRLWCLRVSFMLYSSQISQDFSAKDSYYKQDLRSDAEITLSPSTREMKVSFSP